ncbi:MAG: tetratricopeptide repeat protein [Treponema sp.]|nr:tetratricopeptide repeat protein [Treponema sp.]
MQENAEPVPEQITSVPSAVQQVSPPNQRIEQTRVPASQAPQTNRSQNAPKRDALVLYQRGDYAGAISVCTAELVQNPLNVESYVVMCWALVRNGQYVEAEQRASDGLKISPHDLRLIEIFGEAKYYLGKNNGALEQFQRYVANAPQGASRLGTAYYFMGEIYIRQARYQHADIALSFAVRLEPSSDEWWVQLGYAREMAGNYTEAINAYDEALRLNEGATQAANGKNRVVSRLR